MTTRTVAAAPRTERPARTPTWRRMLGGDGLLVAAGGLSAALPLAAVTGMTREYGLEVAGLLATGSAYAGYASQLVGALHVEGRLAGDPGRRVGVPRELVWLGATGGVAGVAGTAAPVLGVVGLLLLFVALEVSRVVNLVRRGTASESLAAFVLTVAAGAALAFPSSATLFVVLPAAGVLVVAVRCRAAGVDRLHRPSRTVAWVVGETVVSGVAQPLVYTVLHAVAGPAFAVGFRLIVGVGSLFSPVLGFARTRLLTGRQPSTVWFSVGVSALTVAVLVGAEMLELWRAVFGSAWNGIGIREVGLVCVWRVLALCSTLPFAELRRIGRVRCVFVVRLCVSVLNVAMLPLIAVWPSPATALALFTAVEAAAFIMYGTALRQARRARRRRPVHAGHDLDPRDTGRHRHGRL